MALIDRIKYDGGPDELVWKYPSDQIVWGGQLIVNESQEALFFKGGQALDLFTAGTHTLKSGNIPLLEKLINLPFGGDTPFSAEIWYVNKRAFNNLRWGTKTPIQVQDPKYGLFVPVRAFGQYGIRVVDSRHFITEVVGTQGKQSTADIEGFLKGVITSKLSDAIAEMLNDAKVNIVTLGTQLDETSELGKEKLAPTFEKYGLEIIEFFVESINVPEDDPAVQKLKQALADKAEMDILGQQYQQKRMLDIGQTAAGNEGNAGGMMGAGMGMGMGMNMGQMMGGMMNPQMMQGGMQPGMQQQMPQGQQPQAAPAAATGDDPAAKLGKLKNLFEQGLISEEEFNTKKQEILSSL